VEEESMARTNPWEVSDEVWERVHPLIPAAPSHTKGGRCRMEDRKAFEAIVYVLRTGIQWNALPREIGASSTVHDRFQAWERAGFFKALWQAVDGVMTKAPFGHARDRSQPDRSRQTGNQTQSVDRWSGHPAGSGRGRGQSP
jgi:putative transposase